MELVLLVPVLVLLTLFVLWAGRGGRAGLTADLAAEEAATAAALCCDEGPAGEPDRDALAADMLRARPGLQFLCVGGLRPGAAPDGGGGPEFVSEHWLEFDPDPAVHAGGVGVIGVRFMCESDGAVAPLRGLFRAVTFHGQASEVVVRRPPPPDIGFESPVFRVDEGAAVLEFAVVSANPVPQDVYVEYALDSADPGLNHTLPPDLAPPLPPDTVLIAAGDDRVTIAVDLAEDDILHEGTETLVLELTGVLDALGNPLPPAVAQLDPGRVHAAGEVTDDDAAPYLFVSAAAVPCQVTEGGTATFNVRLRNQANTRDAPSASRVTVDFRTDDRTGDGIATAGTDYTAVAATTLAFNAGDVAMPVTVQILDDTAMPEGEPTETFEVVLENASGASPGSSASATCEVLDDEVEVSVGPASADEGDGTLTFTVALDGVPTADVDIGYRLVDHARATHDAQRGGATDTCASAGYPVDYLPLDAIGPPQPPPDAALVISPTTPNQRANVAVTICDDTVAEPDETFWLEIEVQGGEAVVETDGGAVGTITDDDTLAIAVDDASAAEGATLEFEVGLEVGGNPATLVAPVTLDYAIEQDSATEGTDYEAASDQPLTGSLTFENACSVDPETHTTPTACEGVPGATWRAGEQTLQVELLADYLVEGDETFLLKLSDEVGSTHGLDIADAEAIGTITDVPPPYVSVRGFAGPEGSTRSFTVSLNEAPRSGDTVTVSYAVLDDSPRTSRSARQGLDYQAVVGPNGAPLSGTVGFGSGETVKTVPVRLLSDTVNEGDETFGITLSNPDKALLNAAASTATATITNAVRKPFEILSGSPGSNDDEAHLSVADAWVDEGGTMSFEVSLNAASGKTVTVEYRTADIADGATANTDYTPTDWTRLRLDPGTTSATFTVATATDNDLEGAEAFRVELRRPVSRDPGDPAPAMNALIDDALAIGTILEDGLSLRIGDASGGEGSNPPFTVTLSEPATQPVSVDYRTVERPAGPGAATAGSDYTTTSGTLNFAVNEDSKTISVAIATDEEQETDETFLVELSDPVGALLADSSALGTIPGDMSCFDACDDPYEDRATMTVDTPIVDDDLPVLSVGDQTVSEDGATIAFELELHAPGVVASSVDYATAVHLSAGDAAASPLEDYTHTSGKVTFAPGVSTATISVPILGDGNDELDETFLLILSDPSLLELGDSSAVGTITDDDPGWTIDDQSVWEDAGTMVFNVVRDHTGDDPVILNYRIAAAGSAVGGDDCDTDSVDYITPSGSVTLQAADTTATISITLCDDNDIEGLETLVVELTGVPGRKLTGIGTITSDDR